MIAETIADLSGIYSDVYKEAYGHRPRIPTMSAEEFQAEIARLSEVARGRAEEESRIELENAVEVEKRIEELINIGAGDRTTAIRWLSDAEDANGDLNYLCYCLNIPYGYFN